LSYLAALDHCEVMFSIEIAGEIAGIDKRRNRGSAGSSGVAGSNRK
jgi:hypothetical protein